MPYTRSVTLPPPCSNGSCFCYGFHSFSPLGSPLPASYLYLGHLGVRAPGDKLITIILLTTMSWSGAGSHFIFQCKLMDFQLPIQCQGNERYSVIQSMLYISWRHFPYNQLLSSTSINTDIKAKIERPNL